MKANNTYNVVIANEAYNFTSTKYNTTLTGFTSSEAASKAAREALRDIAGEMGKGEKVFFSETLNAWILASPSRGIAGSVWYLTAKVVEVETEAPTDTTPTETEKEPKTMQEIENQAYRLGERNWRRKNVWESSEASRAAKNSRDRLINKAYLNAAAKHLTTKAKAISEFLSVKPMHEAFCVMLDYNSPAVGMALKVASPFCVESLLNDPDKVLALINA